VPFSDPMADGPANPALVAADWRRRVAPAILSMVSECAPRRRFRVLSAILNPNFSLRMRAFCADAARAGIDGMLCVDFRRKKPMSSRNGAANVSTSFSACADHAVERSPQIAHSASGFSTTVA